MFPHHGFIGTGGGGHVVMTSHGPMVIGGGGGGGHLVMTPGGPAMIGGGGGGHLVMGPHGPMMIGGGGGGGHMVMTPHGPRIVAGANGYCCKYCNCLMDEMWDISTVSDSEARRHGFSCPRRQEYDKKAADEATARAEAAARVEREAAARRELAAARARRVSWTSRRGALSATTGSMMSSRGLAPPVAVANPCIDSCRRIADGLIARSPYPGLTFEKLVTPTPTGQAIVMQGSYKGGSNVAIKIFLRKGSSEFDDEVRMLEKVGTHKNVTSMVACFRSPREVVVLPFAEKGTLQGMLEDRAFPGMMVVQYAKQIAEGLCHIHSQGVAHLDIKSENILVDHKNVAHITDFGLSAPFTGNDTISIGMGTMMFIAPEGLESTGSNSDASKMDTYAFGMVMYEMLSGKLPYAEFYTGDNDAFNDCVGQKVLAGDTPAVDRRWDRGIVAVMQECWTMNPHARPSMREVHRRLRDL